jgi:hypothetical protein
VIPFSFQAFIYAHKKVKEQWTLFKVEPKNYLFLCCYWIWLLKSVFRRQSITFGYTCNDIVCLSCVIRPLFIDLN